MNITIGEAASRSGVPAKTIRYYEQIGLIGTASRSANLYRSYSDADVEMLRFIGRARRLGFSVQDLKQLVALYGDHGRASADVKAIALQHIGRIDRKLAELQTVRAALADLASRCHGDSRPDCPILEDLAAGELHAAAGPQPLQRSTSAGTTGQNAATAADPCVVRPGSILTATT